MSALATVDTPPRPARLTVLGGAGFVGSALLAHARASGLGVDAPARGDDSLFKRPLGHVVYAIGLTADFRTRPLETVEAHVCVLRRLLAEAEFESLTYLSSTRVYAGGSDTRESASLRVNPNDASDLYNLSKLTGEALCLHGGRRGAKVARLSNVVGPRRDPDTFIDQLLLEARRSGRVTLRTAPGARKDYIALADTVALLCRIATTPASGIFNLASGEATSNASIAALLREVLQVEVQTQPDAPDWDFAPIDTSRIRAEFGFEPQPFASHFTRFLRAQAAPLTAKETA